MSEFSMENVKVHFVERMKKKIELLAVAHLQIHFNISIQMRSYFILEKSNAKS